MKIIPDSFKRFNRNDGSRLSMCMWLLAVTTTALIVFGTTGYGKSDNGKENAMRWIGIDQLDSIIDEQGPVVIDLRTPLEYERGHLPGAVNVPVDSLKGNRSLLDAYKDSPVLLYCRTVNRTGLALGMLEKRGFKTIYALRGGYEAYLRLRGR